MPDTHANATAGLYYAELAADYPTVIRQLVPRYDDMIESIVDLVAAVHPTRVLDVGSGPGTLARAVLDRLPRVRVTAVEVSGPMVEAARRALAPFGNRATVVRADLGTFQPDKPFDVVCSNLTLHNVPYGEKPAALKAIHAWLAPHGVFVWGDFIRHDDIALQEHTVRYRMAFAHEAGCPKRLIEWTFRKEADEDAPLSMQGTSDTLAATGFHEATPVWMHDAFLIVRAQA